MTFSRGRCLVVKWLCKWLFWQQHLVLSLVPLGLVSGYLGGRLDRVLLFLMDTIYTLPGLLLSVTLAFVVGRGILNAAIAISITSPVLPRCPQPHPERKTELFIEAPKQWVHPPGQFSPATYFST